LFPDRRYDLDEICAHCQQGILHTENIDVWVYLADFHSQYGLQIMDGRLKLGYHQTDLTQGK
jgi:hypothetical protein